MTSNVTVLDELNIVTFLSDGPILDFKNPDKLFNSAKTLGVPFEMEIHSSINGMYRYGSITFFDDSGIRESLPLTGNEIISVMFNNKFRNDSNFQPSVMHFNVFDIEESPHDSGTNDSKRFTVKLIKLHLIECPFFLIYNQKLWQTAFGKNTGTNDPNDTMYLNKIIENHLVKDLKLVDTSTPNNVIELKLQKMSTKMHFVIPSWKTQQTLAYLLDFCRDEDGYGNVKLYNTTNNENGKIRINLRSINSMFKATDRIFEFTHLDVSGLQDYKKINNQSNNKVLDQIIKYRFLFYDITAVTSEMAGGYLLNYDYGNSQYYTMFDTYKNSNSKKEGAYVSNYALWKNEISNENSKQYNLGSFPAETAKKYLNNKITKNKFQLRCEIMTYTNEEIYPGDKIFATFVSGLSELTRDKSFDEHMSDEWIVEDIVDFFRNGKSVRKMTIVKDSFFNLYDKAGGANTASSALPKVNYVNQGNIT